VSARVLKQTNTTQHNTTQQQTSQSTSINPKPTNTADIKQQIDGPPCKRIRSKCPFKPFTQSQPSRHTYHSVAHLTQQLPHTAPLATQPTHIDTQSMHKRHNSMTDPSARGHVLDTIPTAKSVQIIRPPTKLLPHPPCNIYLSLPLLITQLWAVTRNQIPLSKRGEKPLSSTKISSSSSSSRYFPCSHSPSSWCGPCEHICAGAAARDCSRRRHSGTGFWYQEAQPGGAGWGAKAFREAQAWWS